MREERLTDVIDLAGTTHVCRVESSPHEHHAIGVAVTQATDGFYHYAPVLSIMEAA